jgi:hypothetical protein
MQTVHKLELQAFVLHRETLDPEVELMALSNNVWVAHMDLREAMSVQHIA